MYFNRKKLALSSALLLGLPLACGSLFAAQPVNLRHQSFSYLQAVHTLTPAVTVKEVRRNVDFKKTLHVRIQQLYNGHPVFGGDAIVHIPQGNRNLSLTQLTSTKNTAGFMNGVFYNKLQNDLKTVPASALTPAQAQKMQQIATAAFSKKKGNGFAISNEKSELLVYVDASKKAHWAYKITFDAKPSSSKVTPSKPIFIVDAVTGQIYRQADQIETIKVKDFPAAPGGGFGGNLKMGQLIYDGGKGDLAGLKIQRDDIGNLCILQNPDVVVTDDNTEQVITFTCKYTDSEHNDTYWEGDFDTVNGGYSPANDAMSAGIVIKNMYQDWYHVPVLTNDDGSPLQLHMIVHVLEYENAYWDPNAQTMTFGNGADDFYPLTSLGVGAHEISHGFTSQHSNLFYDYQSGGMNEAFSDMAAQAAELYSYGKNSWQIGPEIFKAEGQALRYMDQPSKDCGAGQDPGDWCSIDDASEYSDGLDVHFSSGVYNRFFYNLGTTEGWDAKKAFEVMVQANANYWVENAVFGTGQGDDGDAGSCGVIDAAKDLGYSVDDVKKAFDVVKVGYAGCDA